MNPVLEFLQQHPDYSFDEGVAVLLRYSANRGVNTFITVRRDRAHLRNELNRLAHIPCLRPLPGVSELIPAVETPTPSVEEPEGKQETEGKQPEDQEPEGKQETEGQQPEDQEPGDDIVSFLDLNRHERENPDTLPPMLKELWEKNRDEYKELQYCHAQMKQANSDAGRADWRSQVEEHRASLDARWRLFDEEKARLAAKAEEPEGEKPAYNPGNDRSYITNALKKEEWTDKMKLEVQRRVETMQANGIPFKEETLQRLKERGITVE